MDIYKFRLVISLYENNCNFDIHKDLGISRTNLWWHINAIEKELDIPIIVRGKNKNFFTDFGIAFAKQSKKIIEEYDEIIGQKLDSYAVNENNELIFSTTNAVGVGWFIPLFEEFQKLFPNLRINIFSGDELPPATESYAYIHFRPFDTKEQFTRKWFVKYTHGLFASKTYLENYGTPKNPLDLKDHKIIAYGRHVFSYFDEINWHLKGKYGGLPRLKPYLSINSTAAIYKAAVKGAGICSSSIEANEVEGSKLIRILPRIQGPIVKSYFSVRKDLSPTAQKNVDLFENFFHRFVTSINIKVYED